MPERAGAGHRWTHGPAATQRWGAVVTLDGIVPKDAEREMAESDAWFVFGVDGVENRITVRPE